MPDLMRSQATAAAKRAHFESYIETIERVDTNPDISILLNGPTPDKRKRNIISAESA